MMRFEEERSNHERGAPPDLSPGDYIEYRVRDEGAGMSAEVASRAFEPFFTTKAEGRGTGLGPSQVFGFARKSGGGVHIDSRIGRGTVVTLLLSRAADVPAAAESASTALQGGSVNAAAEPAMNRRERSAQRECFTLRPKRTRRWGSIMNKLSTIATVALAALTITTGTFATSSEAQDLHLRS